MLQGTTSVCRHIASQQVDCTFTSYHVTHEVSSFFSGFALLCRCLLYRASIPTVNAIQLCYEIAPSSSFRNAAALPPHPRSLACSRWHSNHLGTVGAYSTQKQHYQYHPDRHRTKPGEKSKLAQPLSDQLVMKINVARNIARRRTHSFPVELVDWSNFYLLVRLFYYVATKTSRYARKGRRLDC